MGDAAQNHWVFAYGSLIWNPGFSFERRVKSQLSGLTRSLCVYSHRYRGTAAEPGLVFGLRSGGHVFGLAYEVTGEKWAEVRAYLAERELVSNVYKEQFVCLELEGGNKVPALTYIVDETHAQFADLGSVDELGEIVSKAQGSAGTNRDYVFNTLTQLRHLDIHDEELENLSAHMNG